LKQFPKGLKSALVDREVLLEGVITLYRGAPQIELESPAQIRIERHDMKPAPPIPTAKLRHEFLMPEFGILSLRPGKLA
jgi:hypothetical protein